MTYDQWCYKQYFKRWFNSLPNIDEIRLDIRKINGLDLESELNYICKTLYERKYGKII